MHTLATKGLLSLENAVFGTDANSPEQTIADAHEQSCDVTFALDELDYSISVEHVSYRCACGDDILLTPDSGGHCESCGRRLQPPEEMQCQTVSFQSAEESQELGFKLMRGPDRSGECLGHFRLMSKLGYGGMGAVYRALDESLQRLVAVKVIHKDPAQAPETSQRKTRRLLEEAIAQARLNHPNVITIYYVGGEDEPFLAMELLPGPTLAQAIENGPLPYEDIIRYGRQVCSALSQASRLGLVHGDVKPSNLILAGRGVVKLGDFGLAKSSECPGKSKGIMGTLNYMAPELAEGEPQSEISDIYSLGVTLFELAFGRKPFQVSGGTLREQITNRKKTELNFPSEWPEGLPESFEGLLRKMLAEKRSERFQNFDELDAALALQQPAGLVKASLLTRTLALGVDFLLYGMLILPFTFFLQLAYSSVIPMHMRVLTLFALLVPFLATIWESSGNRSLGRFLFQLRLVDGHGLMLGPRRRGLRGLMRNAPIWLAAVSLSFLATQVYTGAALIAGFAVLSLLIDFLPSLLTRKRLAVHDRLAGSHVVLDTCSTSN